MSWPAMATPFSSVQPEYRGKVGGVMNLKPGRGRGDPALAEKRVVGKTQPDRSLPALAFKQDGKQINVPDEG